MGPLDTAWLATSLVLATPLLFTALGELISERAGVINIGLEGMMLSGAFFGFYVHWETGSQLLGFLGGVAAGLVCGALMALLTVRLKANQIVVGVGINVLALGLTTFIFREVFSTQGQVVLHQLKPIAIPGLRHIPVIGRALFDQLAPVYLAVLCVPVAWWLLYRTSWGLSIRAAGEYPPAADTAGIRVDGVRWVAVLVAGGMAGLGGVVLSAQVGLFLENMSGGRGFIALAAVVFGAWRPVTVLGACLFFGAVDALQLRLQSYPTVPHEVWLLIAVVGVLYLVYELARPGRRSRALGASAGTVIAALMIVLFVVAPKVSFPSQLWLGVPYVAAVLALAGILGRSKAPSALGTPYHRS